eukprot:2655433-Prymnesium_polylepis.1
MLLARCYAQAGQCQWLERRDVCSRSPPIRNHTVIAYAISSSAAQSACAQMPHAARRADAARVTTIPETSRVGAVASSHERTPTLWPKTRS